MNDLTPAEQRRDDRVEYLRFTEAANRLSILSDLALSFATDMGAEHDPQLHTFGVPVANYLRHRHEQDAAWYARQAQDAREIAATYRALLTGEAEQVGA